MSTAAVIANVVSAVLWVAMFVLLLIDWRILPGRNRLRRIGTRETISPTVTLNLTPDERFTESVLRNKGVEGKSLQ